jgi:hypothetical protein
VSLDAAVWWRILMFGALLFGAVEIEKIVLRKWNKK